MKNNFRWRVAAIAAGLPLCLLLAACPEPNPWGIDFGSIDSAFGPASTGPEVWVSDNGMSVFNAGSKTSDKINFAPNATSLTYWQQGPNPEFGAEVGACFDSCSKLFYVSGGKLFAMSAPVVLSTPVSRPIATQYTPGRVDWGGAGGSVLYVTYPNNAAIGVIGGVSETEYANPSNPFHHTILLPGTSPYAMALGAPTGSTHYIISGTPGPGQKLVAFNDNGPVSGLPSPSVTVATAIGANQNFVAVIAGGRLLVYNADLSFWGAVTNTPKGWNPNNVVVDQNSDMAYVTSLSAPNVPGQVDAVDLDSLAVVGPSVTVGNGPFNMRLSWDGKYLLVANQNDGPPGTVSVLSVGAGGASLDHTITVGTKPGALTIRP